MKLLKRILNALVSQKFQFLTDVYLLLVEAQKDGHVDINDADEVLFFVYQRLDKKHKFGKNQDSVKAAISKTIDAVIAIRVLFT
jgi:hypothetical protein